MKSVESRIRYIVWINTGNEVRDQSRIDPCNGSRIWREVRGIVGVQIYSPIFVLVLRSICDEIG